MLNRKALILGFAALLFGAVEAMAQGAPATPPASMWEGKTPPPRPKAPPADGKALGGPKGTLAPDGVGAAVRQVFSVGEFSAETMTYVPWEDASAIQPLKVGAAIPKGSVVRSAEGNAFNLLDAARAKPTVLIFYRGGWCPYCNAYLSNLQEIQPELQKMGYQILAVSTDTPEDIRKFVEKNKLDYTLLSDTKLEVAALFGLRYKITQKYIDHVKDVASQDLQAKTDGYLLTPGAFVLDQRGVVRFVYVNNNYTVRVSDDALLNAARAALKK